MITLTSIVFSVMFVMMQLMFTAYSKRLVMIFAAHPIGLHVLGVFSATFLCALGVLQFVDRDHGGNVPWLSMEVATALLVLSMIMLALLIQRVGVLRITYVLQFIGNKGRAVIVQTLPRLEGHNAAGLVALRQKSDALRAQKPTQTLTYDGIPLAIANFRVDALVRLGQQAGGTIVMRCAVGDTVAQGTRLLEVYGATTQIPERLLANGIVLSPERTFEQDPKYPLRLLVDTAIMALSPAVNDPTTAVQAIDQIEDLLNRLGRRALDAGFITDAQGELRLVSHADVGRVSRSRIRRDPPLRRRYDPGVPALAGRTSRPRRFAHRAQPNRNGAKIRRSFERDGRAIKFRLSGPRIRDGGRSPRPWAHPAAERLNFVHAIDERCLG